jgi:hypothetical protein
MVRAVILLAENASGDMPSKAARRVAAVHFPLPAGTGARTEHQSAGKQFGPARVSANQAGATEDRAGGLRTSAHDSTLPGPATHQDPQVPLSVR